MRALLLLLFISIILQNVRCHKRNLINLLRDDGNLPKMDEQESQMNSFSLPKDVTHLLTMSRQPRMQTPPSRVPALQLNGPRQGPMGSSQPTRPHPVFHAPPPRFGANFPVEGNQLDLDFNDEGTGTVLKDSNEQWPLPAPETPKIVHLDVKCEKSLMKVSIEFDKPFNGVVFSKGHFNYRNCLYLPPNTGRKSVFFDISINACGTSGNAQGTFYNEDVNADSGLFFENTVVIQYDPQVQEAWDQARKLRCTWHDQYEKAVSFRPFPVDMLDVVRADFAGDNVGCWMQIQVGKGPWASEVAGIVKIGQTMTMVLAIKDEENKFDMLVRNCIAHDGKRAPIELVDGNGCIMRPKLMTRFTKIKNFGSSASVLSYTHFQAFKFPDSMEVHFQCTIQICRSQCPEQCSQQAGADVINLYNGGEQNEHIRKKRDTSEQVLLATLAPSRDSSQVGLNKAIQVVSPRDLSFALDTETTHDQMALISKDLHSEPNSICVPAYGFVLSIIFVCLACVLTTIVTFAFLRKPSKEIVEKNKLPNLYEMIRVN